MKADNIISLDYARKANQLDAFIHGTFFGFAIGVVLMVVV